MPPGLTIAGPGTFPAEALEEIAARCRAGLGREPPEPAVYASLSAALEPYAAEIGAGFLKGDPREGEERGRARLLAELVHAWVEELPLGGFDARRVRAVARRAERFVRVYPRPGAGVAALGRLRSLLAACVLGWERVPLPARLEWARAIGMSVDFESAAVVDLVYARLGGAPARVLGEEATRHVAQLRHAEERLQFLAELVDYPVFVLDEAGSFLWINSAAAAWFRVPAGDFPAASLRAMLVGGDLPEEMYIRARALVDGREGGIPSTTHQVLRRGGEEVEVELTLSAWRPVDVHDAPWLYSVLLRDTSPRASMDEALRRSESGYRALIEATPDAVVVVQEGRIVFANPAATALAGRTREELLALSGVYELLHAEEQEPARNRYARLLAMTGPPRSRNLRLVRPGGEQREIEASAIPLHYRGGRSLLLVARDVTARNLLQARMMRAERLTTVGTLARGLAHELSTPFSAIRSNVEYVRRELGPDAPGETAAALAETDECASRVEVVLYALRAFGGDEEAEPGEVDLGRIVQGAAAMVAGTIGRRGAIKVSVLPGVCLLANEARLGQAFLAILVNAAQALPHGSRGHVVTVTMSTDTDRVFVVVTDDGEGIPPENLGRIFDPFFTTRPVGTGTGLGLSAALGIVRQLGGDIEVSSQVGKGTSVKVSLPTR